MFLLKLYVINHWYTEDKQKNSVTHSATHSDSQFFNLKNEKKMEIGLQYFFQNSSKDFYYNFENKQLLHVIAYEPKPWVFFD